MDAGSDDFALKRITAYFTFNRSRRVELDEERIEFPTGRSLRLFFSYRYTSALIREALKRAGLEVLDAWVARSEEEGVFLCRRG